MEYTVIPGTQLRVSRIALGTWAIGGWMWGGADEAKSVATIHAALDKGVSLIDTAPVYGFGASESVVGKALAAYGKRDQVLLSTKVGLAWKDGAVYRDGSRERVMREIEDSLARLGTDHVDMYYVHWPDCTRDIAETARAMRELFEAGTIRAVGVSNFTPNQMRRFLQECPLHVCQPPYNIFERGIEQDIMGFCRRHDIAVMAYGALCRGLLSGKMRLNQAFQGDDLRRHDPKFQTPRLGQYLQAVEELQQLARGRYDKSLVAFAVRYVLEKDIDITIWGGRSPEQMQPLEEMLGWSMDYATLSAVDSILAECLQAPVGPEFMAPPTGLVK